MKTNRVNDRKKFVHLANKRVNNALKTIKLIGNLANKSNYEYRDEDIAKIFKALQGELQACKKRYELAQNNTETELFSLEERDELPF